MNKGKGIRFRLAISADKYLRYYQGAAKNVVVRAEDGRNVKFPANAIQRFLRHEGIYGLFEIFFDENNKLKEVRKLAD